jgi:hypothetical protein
MGSGLGAGVEATTGATGFATAGVDEVVAGVDVPESELVPPEAASRRSFERLSRCSGISVTVFLVYVVCLRGWCPRQ